MRPARRLACYRSGRRLPRCSFSVPWEDLRGARCVALQGATSLAQAGARPTSVLAAVESDASAGGRMSRSFWNVAALLCSWPLRGAVAQSVDAADAGVAAATDAG